MKYAVLIFAFLFSGCAGIMKQLAYSADQGKTFAQKEYEWNKTRQEYVLNHPDLPEKKKNAILGGQHMIGLSKEESIATFGEPAEKNLTVVEGLRSEQWVYRRGGDTYQYLYFDNGTLKAWQN